MRVKDESVALSLMTDDVVLVGPIGPPIVGRDAVRGAFFPRAGWKEEFEETVTSLSVEVLGEIAIVVREASATATLTIAGGTLPPFSMSGRTILVFRKQVDGWKLARWLNLMQKVKGPAPVRVGGD